MRGDFNIASNDNTLFVTYRCNNNCMMCCQPPENIDDIEELMAYNKSIVARAPKGIKTVGISGGEPTLLGDRLVQLISYVRETLPNADIHLLSNGRNFKDADYTRSVVSAANGRLIVGIPLHSDYSGDHDTIAGVKRSFYETIAGLYNLAGCGAAIELRIVINRLNHMRLPYMADFICKNLPFVTWTAFMAMELIGHAEKNEHNIWVEPHEYSASLAKAVLSLAQSKKDVAVYNVPLCLIPKEIHEYAQKSISDWKSIYLPQCEQCKLKSECCGLFATSRRPFESLSPIV